MNSIAANAYSIAYSSIDRFQSIIFFHNYFLTFFISIFCSIILPIIYFSSPVIYHSTRMIYLLLILIICLTNMFVIFIQMYFLTGSGEPNLSFNWCRFMLYISTLAKPMNIYLIFLFSLERFITKIIRIKFHSEIFRRIFQIFIYSIIVLVLSIRLFQIYYLPIINPLNLNQTIISNNNFDENSTMSFRFCFNSIQISIYSKILSFYIIQYWYEYYLFGIICLLCLILIIQQIRLFTRHISLHTKFYFILSLTMIVSELFILLSNYIISNPDNNNQFVQTIFLQIYLFIFHLRCICLPLSFLYIQSYPMKEFIWEFIFDKPYLENIYDHDRISNHLTNNNLLLEQHITQDDL